MITKTAILYSAYKNLSMSEKDKDVLRKHYKLDDDSNLFLRSAGREFIGTNVGSLGGGLVGGVLTAGHPLGTTLGAIAGMHAGAHYATGKYSKSNANKIRRRNQED